jgi:prepilin-type N-terminal cleavage/methylation domain-containing protein
LRIFEKNRSKRGVTLIELAVVLAIIAIMAVFMAPAIGEWLDNYRIKQTARDIASALQLAKMQTISTRAVHLVSFPTANSYQITPEGNVTQFAKGVSLKTGSTISFNLDGTSNGGTIIIKNADDDKEYQVTVSAAGRIQIQ